MLNLRFLLLLICLGACQSKPTSSSPQTETPFFLGTYTDSISKGIYAASLDHLGHLKIKQLAAKSINPSYLTKSPDGKYLLAVNEISNANEMGTVESFEIYRDSLSKKSTRSSGGAHPCYISVNNEGLIFTANYSGGNIGLLQLQTGGTLSELLDTQSHHAVEPQEKELVPHAHSAWFDEATNTILSADLGTNQVWITKLNDQGDRFDAERIDTVNMDKGAGPRHLVRHPEKQWIYSVNELNSSITLLVKTEEGTYLKKESVSTLPRDYQKQSYGADLHISSDGKFLYASNRGHNSIAIFSIDPTTGSLNLIATESVRGDWPRNFALSPTEEFLVVANQRSKNIVSFKRDAVTGLLQFIHEIDAPTPVCILFY